MNHSTRRELARETVEIVERGYYDLSDNRRIEIGPCVAACLAQTRFFLPEELETLKIDVLSRPAKLETAIEVCNETTLAGIARLLSEGSDTVAALNFASAKNPGGGFLNGSQAQEESLARSSALYASLLRAPQFYERHRGMSSCLYTDAMILSPGCPVFRDNSGALLPAPLTAAFITSPAPSAGAIADNAPTELQLVPETFARRSEYVLAMAAAHGYRDVVLGAWGCGVFRNDPVMVAQTFATHLRGAWAGRFRRVVFSVFDATPKQQTLSAFSLTFDGAAQ